MGYQDHKSSYLFNHVNIIVEYHPLDDGSRSRVPPGLGAGATAPDDPAAPSGAKLTEALFLPSGVVWELLLLCRRGHVHR